MSRISKRKEKEKIVTTYYDNRHPDYVNFYNVNNFLSMIDPDNAMWEGRKPHHIDSETNEAVYNVWFGSATLSPEGKVLKADVILNHKVSLWILWDHLKISDARNDGVPRAWVYSITNGKRDENIWPGTDLLEDERIERMLQVDNIDSPLWETICKRAREMWEEELNTRDVMHRYSPGRDIYGRRLFYQN